MNLFARPPLDALVRRLMGAVILGGFAATAPLPAAPPAQPAGPELVAQASAALQQGQLTNAIELATKIIAADPANFRAWAIRGRARTLLRQPALAIPDYTAALKLDPSSAGLYQARGEEHFRLGQFKESVADFDRCLEISPDQKPYHWQRGISCYYARQFEEGRKQFELHQSVNSHDVENAVWHFLCLTRVEGLEKARAALIPIDGDTRVPMSQVHGLFAGKLKPDDVLAAARKGDPAAPELNNRLFYAHLYLGLYFEATGNTPAAREHIFLAAEKSRPNDYMGDVARSHANVLRRQPRN